VKRAEESEGERGVGGSDGVDVDVDVCEG